MVSLPLYPPRVSQSISAVAATRGIPYSEAERLLAGLFTSLGARCVLSGATFQAMSAYLEADRFIAEAGKTKLPVVVSLCPGEVVYATKTKRSLLPYMSDVPSQQSVAGHYIKAGLVPGCTSHMSLQPCFDRKLEAADPANVYGSTPLTDFTLSTTEALGLIQERTEGDASIPPCDTVAVVEGGQAEMGSGNSMGGYGDMLAAVLSLRGWVQEGGMGEWQKGRNMHWLVRHVSLTPDCPLVQTLGTDTLTLARVSSFKNTVNLTNALKRKEKIHMVELGACPGGCINGGAQLAPEREREYDLRTLKVAGEVLAERFGSGTEDQDTLDRALAEGARSVIDRVCTGLKVDASALRVSHESRRVLSPDAVAAGKTGVQVSLADLQW
ncbi:hypothetical protein KIPB_000228 [Kipferlia bialata]|uniref:Iron hydrogenase large subunit C-terminal domain-containing protein n=1 Tax=Kipferlia bialata TaxID=797122 RepID=A0A9K3CNV2_9EUKA|nr:hypothetical protein KIPB_000228 [Kipferlia bialata]|eukprot:g228.t1